MKVTDEKNGTFSFSLHNINKKLNESHFHYSGLNVSILLLIIKKSKDTHYKY